MSGTTGTIRWGLGESGSPNRSLHGLPTRVRGGGDLLERKEVGGTTRGPFRRVRTVDDYLVERPRSGRGRPPPSPFFRPPHPLRPSSLVVSLRHSAGHTSSPTHPRALAGSGLRGVVSLYTRSVCKTGTLSRFPRCHWTSRTGQVGNSGSGYRSSSGRGFAR